MPPALLDMSPKGAQNPYAQAEGRTGGDPRRMPRLSFPQSGKSLRNAQNRRLGMGKMQNIWKPLESTWFPAL